VRYSCSLYQVIMKERSVVGAADVAAPPSKTALGKINQIGLIWGKFGQN